jgi:hypothetical protein
MTNDDMQLVREYAARQSESAFATLVSRDTNLVYSGGVAHGKFLELCIGTGFGTAVFLPYQAAQTILHAARALHNIPL